MKKSHIDTQDVLNWRILQIQQDLGMMEIVILVKNFKNVTLNWLNYIECVNLTYSLTVR